MGSGIGGVIPRREVPRERLFLGHDLCLADAPQASAIARGTGSANGFISTCATCLPRVRVFGQCVR